MRSPSRTPKSTLISNKWLEPEASLGGHTLLVRQELEKMRECRARMFPVDRKVVRRCNRFVAIAARAPLHVRVNHRAGQTRSIQLDKLLHTPEQARSFGGRNRKCT